MFRNPFRRRPPLTPNPSGSKFPAEWVTLLFTLRDSKGHYRHAVEMFDSELGAANFMNSARPELLDGFKGAYREVPGFLNMLDVAERHKQAIQGPSIPAPPQDTPEAPDVDDIPHLVDPADVDLVLAAILEGCQTAGAGEDEMGLALPSLRPVVEEWAVAPEGSWQLAFYEKVLRVIRTRKAEAEAEDEPYRGGEI